MYYNITVEHQVPKASGSGFKKENTKYLVEGESIHKVENRLWDFLPDNLNAPKITKVSESNVSVVMLPKDNDPVGFFQARISHIGEKGAETIYLFVGGDDFISVAETVEEYYRDMMADFNIEGITSTKALTDRDLVTHHVIEDKGS